MIISLLLFIGFLYILGSVFLFLSAKKLNFINRIFRITPVRSVSREKPITGKNILLRNLIDLLEESGFKIGIEEFLIVVSISFTSVFSLFSFFKFSIPVSAILSLILPVFFLIFINFRGKRLLLKKEEQFEKFMLYLMGNLYADPSILNGLCKSVKNLENPLKEEFEIVLNDTGKGLLLGEALMKMFKRTKSTMIKTVLQGIIFANEKGVDMVSFVRSQLELVRERKQMQNYIKVLSSGPRYTAYVIMAIPIAVLIIGSIINKNMLSVIASKEGIMVLSYFIISNIIGLILINKITGYRDRGILYK